MSPNPHSDQLGPTASVSVIIPAFNREATIERAIRSALEQIPPPTEVVVVDDGSTDSTFTVAQGCGIRIISNTTNLGVSRSRNLACDMAIGSWIAFLDSDDYWLPGHLERLLAHRTGDRVIIASGGVGSLDRRPVGHPGPAPLILKSPVDAILPFNRITPSGCMVRKDIFDAVGGFSGRRHVEDLELWVTMLEFGPGIVLGEISFSYGQHSNQLSSDRAAMDEALMSVINSFHDRPWWNKRLVARASAMPIWDAQHAIENSSISGKLRTVGKFLHPWRFMGLIELLILRRQARHRKIA